MIHGGLNYVITPIAVIFLVVTLRIGWFAFLPTSRTSRSAHLPPAVLPSQLPSRAGRVPAGGWAVAGKQGESVQFVLHMQAGPASATPGHSHETRRRSIGEDGFVELEPLLLWGCCGSTVFYPDTLSTLRENTDCSRNIREVNHKREWVYVFSIFHQHGIFYAHRDVIDK